MYAVKRLKAFIILGIFVFTPSCGTEFSGSGRFVGSGGALAQHSKKLRQGEIGDIFEQFSSVQEESFQQAISESKLDLLVVVDNSRSMRQEQVNLSTKLAPLLSHVNESDWQIAVTTTDENDDCLRPDGLIKAGEASVASRFQSAVNAGIGGDGDEAGLHMAVRTLSMLGCDNPSALPWIRKDSAIAVLFVSDEDNCSAQGFGSDCTGEPQQNPSYLTDYLSTIRQLGVSAKIYGLIWQPGTSCSTGLNVGYTYDTVIKATGGTTGSICDNDYSQTLESISYDIAATLESRFTLKAAADPTSLEVTVNGIPAQLEYKVFGNVVSFTEPPPPGSDVKIKYRAISTEGRTRYKLSRSFEGDIFVKVGSEYLDQNDYKVDPKTNEVVLRNPPGPGEKVFIFYGEEGRIRATFPVEPNIRVGAIEVTINGEKTDAWEYDNENGLLIFDEVPPENADIVVNYAR